MSCSPPRDHGEVPSPGRAAENGLDAHGDEEDLEDEVDSAHLDKFMRDRRRARSLPAYPGALLDPESGRKRVKFADSMGLTLARVRHFSIQEDPQVPVKVLSRHAGCPQVQTLWTGPDADRLVACFPELRDADRRVRQLRVCLEAVVITQLGVRGHIRVLRGGGPADVGVRYTFNDWQSYVDAQALPVTADGPGPVGERFSFSMHTPTFADPRASVHFAVYMRDEDGDFWDNNDTHNYTLRYSHAHDHAHPSTSQDG